MDSDLDSCSSDSSALLLEGARRAMEDFDALLLPPSPPPCRGEEAGGARSSGAEKSRCVRFHSAAAAHDPVGGEYAAEHGEEGEGSVPARHVSHSQARQEQRQQSHPQQAQQTQHQQQPQQQQQQQQQRTRKFDGRRIRNLSSRIRGRMHQEQQQYQQYQQYQNQHQDQTHQQQQCQTQYQYQNQDGSSGGRSGLVRRASLDGNGTIPGEHDDHDDGAEAKVRRRASDIGNTPTSSPRDRREYRHAHTLPPERTAPPVPSSSRSLSRDELRALGRKAGAAVAGGSLIALGIPLLPMPGPVGEAMSIGGMAVLAKEFPAAQKVLDVGRDKLVEVLDKTAPPPTEEDGEHDGDEDGDDGEHDEYDGEEDDYVTENTGLDPKVAAHHHDSMHSDDGGGVIGAATNLSQRCASDSVRCNQQPSMPQHYPPRQAAPPPEGDYFHLHDELLLTSPSSSARHLHRHNYHQGHYGHHGHCHHRRQGSWRNRNKQKQKKKKRGPSKLKRSLHRSIHGMGTKVVLPLMDTVCTEREGAASSSSSGGGGGVGASTRKAFAGARSRLRSTFQSLSNEVAAGWREVEEEYAQQAQAQAEAAKLAHLRRVQELEQQQQQQRMRLAQEQQQRRRSLQAGGESGAATANRSVFQQLLDASNGDANAMQRRGSYASASSSGQYEEDYVEEEDEEWETESCPERWIDVDESLWETMSL